MATISIPANTVRPSVDRRLHDTSFGTGIFSLQDPVHSWKAGPYALEKQTNKTPGTLDSDRPASNPQPWSKVEVYKKECTETQPSSSSSSIRAITGLLKAEPN